MGAMSKDREWMPRSDHNRLSWSFAFVVLSGFFSVFCLFGLVTHHLSVESRILMEDPSVREKLLGSDAKSTHLKSTSGFDIGPGTDSRLGGVPSLFTVPQTGSLFGPGSTFLAPGASSALSRGTVAPGAIGAAAQGTSAATVSAKLRQTLEAQKAAVLAAKMKAADSGVTGTSNSALLYQQHARAEPMPSGSLHRQYQGPYSHLHPDVAMDSNV
ncbi:unnamed protein product [Dicrocoelium dendriticum]|nr:unnamed protein product [Dicrocoelium dendriticum]